jgi:hypothetical protein
MHLRIKPINRNNNFVSLPFSLRDKFDIDYSSGKLTKLVRVENH